MPIARSWGHAGTLQQLADQGAQGHRTYRLVQQMITFRAGLDQSLGGGVAADQESRDGCPEGGTQVLDRFDAGFPQDR